MIALAARMNALNEKSIRLRVANGDQRAFRLLFDKYSDGIYANELHFTQSPELAQDLAQEIFTKIRVLHDKLPEVARFICLLSWSWCYGKTIPASY